MAKTTTTIDVEPDDEPCATLSDHSVLLWIDHGSTYGTCLYLHRDLAADYLDALAREAQRAADAIRVEQHQAS